MLFSATLDNGVDIIVRRYLSNPVHHSVDSAESPVAQMTHHVLEVADAAAKLAVVRQLAGGTGRRVLFLRTKHQAKKLAKQLVAEGIAAVDLHGNLGQAARERNLAAFGSGEATVLVATDIAARGIHVDDVELVVHVDPPAEHKAYLHRSGRTARAGAEGVVVTLVLPEQRADVRAMTRAAKITAQPRPVTPGDATVGALAGEPAPRRAVPVAAPVEASSGAGGRRSGGSGGGGRGGRGGRGAAPAGRTAGAPARSSGQARTRRGPAVSPVFTTSSPSRGSSAPSASRGSSASSASSASRASSVPRATPAAAGAPAQRSAAPRHSRRASAPAGTPRSLGERSWRA
jgi:superfamily II DNA/RNA helicase